MINSWLKTVSSSSQFPYSEPSLTPIQFNMRELSKVFQGVILATRDRFNKSNTEPYGGHVTTPEGYLLGCWIHECRRVFSDKLVS